MSFFAQVDRDEDRGGLCSAPLCESSPGVASGSTVVGRRGRCSLSRSPGPPPPCRRAPRAGYARAPPAGGRAGTRDKSRRRGTGGGGKKKSADGESIREERGEATERAFKDKLKAEINRSIERVKTEIDGKSSLRKAAYTIEHVLQAVREGDAERVRVACESLKVEDMKAVLRELGGAVYGTRALLLVRILRFLPGSSAKSQGSSADPREVLGTGGERRPVLAQSLKSAFHYSLCIVHILGE